jgi:hypothetical protein
LPLTSLVAVTVTSTVMDSTAAGSPTWRLQPELSGGRHATSRSPRPAPGPSIDPHSAAVARGLQLNPNAGVHPFDPPAAWAVRHRTLARRRGMRSWTAMQPVAEEGMDQEPSNGAGQRYRRTGGRPTQSDRILTRDGFSGRQMPHRTPRRPAFPLVRAYMEPPAGIEPATPSLPWNHQEPLCGPPFPQLTPDRRGRGYLFSFGRSYALLSIEQQTSETTSSSSACTLRFRSVTARQ